MAHGKIKVTLHERKSGEIPEVFTVGAAAVTRLERIDFGEEVARRLILPRKDGMTGDILFNLLVLMTFGNVRGQRALQTKARGATDALANAVRARHWFKQAAMSRALRSVTPETSRTFCDWLLNGALPISAVERSASAFHRDAMGQRWRVYDTDGRVRAIRQRGLPTGEDLPEPRRHAEQVAKPGYPGRKRGETQFHQMIVQDAGAGAFIGVRIGLGNGAHRDDMRWAAETAAQYHRRLDADEAKAILRFDGKAAGMPAIFSAVDAGLDVVTRWADYSVLEHADAVELFQTPGWAAVPDSGSGPRRKARELFIKFVSRSDGSKQQQDCADLEVRVVVTRYKLSKNEKHGCGRELNGYVYEMFATTLAPDAWPADDLVALYYGRSAEENHFAELDRKFPVNHILSWHLPAQQLWTAAGLMAWNTLLGWGAEMVDWTESTPPAQDLRQELETEVDPALHTAQLLQAETSQAASPVVAQPVAKLAESADAVVVPVAVEVDQGEQSTVSTTPNRTNLPDSSAAARIPTIEATGREHVVPNPDIVPAPEHVATELTEATRPIQLAIARMAVLAMLGQPSPPARLLNWRWNEEADELHCPADRPFRLRSIQAQSSGSDAAWFRIRERHACRDCELRRGCTKSLNPTFRKELTVTVRSGARHKRVPRKGDTTAIGRAAYHRPHQLASSQSPTGGPKQAAAPALAPAVLRNAVHEILGTWRVRAFWPAVQATRAPPPWMTSSAAQRQHRRLTWQQRRIKVVTGAAELQLYHPAIATSARGARRVLMSVSRPASLGKP